MSTPRGSDRPLQNWSISSEVILRLMASIAIMLLMALLWDESLPDYASYQGLFASQVASNAYNRLFGAAVQAAHFLGVDYGAFRWIVLLAGVLFFTLLARTPKDGGRAARNQVIFYSALFLLLFLFLFEFYEVRLRAGIACLLFALAFLPEIASAKRSTNWLFRLAQVLLLAASLWLHSSTFAAIFLFCVPPLLFAKYAPGWAKHLTGPFALVLAILWFGLFYQVVSVAPTRGETLFSPLNSARFLALFAVPMALFVVFDLPASRADRQIGQGVSLFPLLLSINYLICAAVLAGFYFTGNLQIAGEAIVRVMTLSSLPAALVIMRWGIGYARVVPMYLLACNGLFFVNTVYL
ncbi:MAG: hypothetical protein KKF14_03420 [Alphaproteobacteria bacterium]|nr:hypothetical protein [Alphaproteobacteria bacterium]